MPNSLNSAQSTISDRTLLPLQEDPVTDSSSLLPPCGRKEEIALSSSSIPDTLDPIPSNTLDETALTPLVASHPPQISDNSAGIAETSSSPDASTADTLIGTSSRASITGPTGESNDSLTQAIQTFISSSNPSNVSVAGSIGDNPNLDSGLDVDFYVVQMSEGDRLILDIDAQVLGSVLDSGLRLFDASGNELAFSDDDAAPGESPVLLDSYLDFTAAETGNYYVGVSGFANFDYDAFTVGSGSAGSTGDYTLNISLSTSGAESNDTLTTATLTGLTNATPGTVNYIGAIGDNPDTIPTLDVDLYAVQLGQGDTLLADLDVASGAYLDSVFRLFDAEGNEIAFSDDDAAPGEDPNYDSFLSFTAEEAGNYFLGISGYGNFEYDPFFESSGISGGTGGYSLNLTVELNDSDLVGDSVATAYDTGLTAGISGTFVLETTIGDNPSFVPGLDVDFFSFQLNQGDLATIDIDFVTSANALDDSVLILFDEQGNELAFSDDGAAVDELFTFESYLSFLAAETGTYYVGVSGYLNWFYDPMVPGSGSESPSTGDYSIEITVTASEAVPNDDFSSFYGYGMTDAAAAIATATGSDSFAPVADLGGDLWGLDRVNAPEVWAQGYTGEGVVVAVLDTGVDYTHPDLIDNIWTNTGEIADNGVDDDGNGFIDDIVGWNFVYDTNDPMDFDGHGTHVSGTIAGMNDGFGITGVAYDATIMPVTVIGDWFVQDEYEYLQDIADGIIYAVDNGADVINMSLGYSPAWYGGTLPPEETVVADAIAYAHDQGTVVVMAAGNEYANQPGYPATYATDWGISVGAVDSNSQIASFSNYAGPNELDYVVGPGVDVYSTIPNGEYDYFSGTSMATPHVAGVAALVMGADPDLTAAEVEDILTGSANPVGVLV